MAHSIKRPLIQTTLAALLITGCVSAPVHNEETSRQGALQRWNQCLERFNHNLEHYCDGHRRDVLGTYPAYRQKQINNLLVNRTRAKSKSR